MTAITPVEGSTRHGGRAMKVQCGCGAQLRQRDRYCVSCGLPNTQSDRIARFAPSAPPREQRDVYVKPEPPPPGGFPCPRCEGPAARTDAYCRSCGLFLEEARVRASAPPEDPRQRFMTFEMDPYRRPESTPLLRALCWTSAAVTGGLAAVNLTWLAALVGWQSAIAPGELETVSTVLARLAVLAGLATWIVAAIWFRRVYRNLGPLESGRTRLPRRWAVLGWLVPPLVLVVPKLTIDEAWRRSSPHGPPVTARWSRERLPLALHLWWPSLILGGVLAVISFLVMPTGASIATEEWRITIAMATMANLLLVGGMVSLAGLVDEVTSRQAIRHEVLDAWHHGKAPDPALVMEDPDEPWMARPRYTHSSGDTAGRY